MHISRSKLSIYYIVAIVILLALISVSGYIASRNMETQSDAIVNDAIPLTNAANSLLTDLINQETGIRGFVVAGDPQFLEPFNQGKEMLDKELSDIRAYEDKYPHLRMQLESQALPIIDRVESHFNNQINLVQNGKLEEAHNLIVNGKKLMDQYRSSHVRMTTEIQAITQEAYSSTKKAGKYSRAITTAGGGVALVIGVLSWFIFFRANRAETELRKSEETYRYMAESLESQNEEIIAQQEEQQATLSKLSEREKELELITSYQEKLTGYLDLKVFLQHSIPALLDSLNLDAALVIIKHAAEPHDEYEVVYASGYPIDFVTRKETELFGPAKRVFDEGKGFIRKRELTDKERGLQDGHRLATDQYIPLCDENQSVIGFLLLTNYQSYELDVNDRLIRGLTKQFGLAFYTQVMNEEKRLQAYNLEKLYQQLSAEKRLIEDQRDLIESILEAAHEGMMMCDSHGNILFANQRMRRYFNLHLQITHNLIDSCREIAASTTSFTTVLSSIEALIEGSLTEFTQRFNFEDEAQMQHAELYATIVGEDTDQRGYLFVFRDRTEEERVDEMKNEFISIVSHELRTPLSSVLGFIEILLHRELPQDKQKKYMDTIHKEAQRLSNLINDFLDLQRMESGHQAYHFAPVDLVPTVQEVSDQWQDKQDHHIQIHHNEPEIWIRADVDRIRQVFHNLISNAIKYSPGADKLEIYLETKGDKVSISVQDYGLGIPQDASEQLFSKFFRVDNSDRRQIGGTGLGLSIVKEIVEGHHGQITFSSVMGEGTTFTIELETTQISPMGGKIVIFEDDDNLANLIKVALNKLDLPSIQIRSAEEGILSLHRLQGERAILFIVDIHLEGTKTGWDFLAELYRDPIHYQTPVIVSTALDQPHDYHEKEIEKYLKKPFTMERLIQVAQTLIASKGTTSYVFPAQNKEQISSNLKINGIEVTRIRENLDIVEVEIKKRTNGIE
jgi:signal transduction histidine kinase/CHASE3 domain sensor protein/CheY-like chemotaxis protein